MTMPIRMVNPTATTSERFVNGPARAIMAERLG